MRVDCNYDPARDVKQVDQTGFIDLAKANAMNSIPSQLGAVELSYNGIEDPNSIGGRPSDSFEAAQMAKTISGYKAPKQDISNE